MKSYVKMPKSDDAPAFLFEIKILEVSWDYTQRAAVVN